MYPLIELGPLRLSSGGLLLLSMLVAQWLARACGAGSGQSHAG